MINLKIGKVLLKGQDESCKITMDVMATITYTNCKRLTNSKGVKILCTKRKSMCKTEKEVDNFIYRDNYILKETLTQLNLENLQDMSYYKARKLILKAGYTPRINPNPPQFGQANKLYKHGYKEVDDCASIATMPCNFEFNTNTSKRLIVTTYTQEPNLLDVFVVSAYLE
jgi:hypothetical protein